MGFIFKCLPPRLVACLMRTLLYRVLRFTTPRRTSGATYHTWTSPAATLALGWWVTSSLWLVDTMATPLCRQWSALMRTLEGGTTLQAWGLPAVAWAAVCCMESVWQSTCSLVITWVSLMQSKLHVLPQPCHLTYHSPWHDDSKCRFKINI